MQTRKFEAIICNDVEDLLGLTQKWRSEGHRIVFTNGCFDILHAGHVDYLRKAALEGDRLIVGINGDESVNRLKGEDRPVNSIDKRIKVLGALRFVDALIVFHEDTPLKLITSLVPDVLVKGGDYKDKVVVGSEVVEKHGGKVKLIDFVYDVSTSKIIRKKKREIHD